MEPELIFREIASEHHGIRIVPPQAPVLPTEAQVLPGDTAEDGPGALDVTGAARAIDQSKRRPEGMIATQDKAVFRAAQNSPHAAPVGFDARRLGVAQTAAVHGAPE